MKKEEIVYFTPLVLEELLLDGGPAPIQAGEPLTNDKGKVFAIPCIIPKK